MIGGVIGQLVRGLEIDRTFAFQAEQLARIQSLTTADIKQALQSHLGNLTFVEMQAGDLSNAGQADAGVTAPATSSGANELPERMKRFDANGDGKLQKSEAPERMGRFFDRMDTNSDGAIDAEEAAAMRGRRGRGGGWRPRSGRPQLARHHIGPRSSFLSRSRGLGDFCCPGPITLLRYWGIEGRPSWASPFFLPRFSASLLGTPFPIER